MYGMIHCAIREMAVEAAGPDVWRKVEAKTGIGPSEMISALVYEDELTISILAAVAEVLGVTLPECLDRFGRFFVRFAGEGAYAQTVRLLGNDIVSFFTHLDQMHAAVLGAMPGARVPSFSVVEAGEGRLLVRYRSERPGLEPFVVGLFQGVLERFALTGEIAILPGNSSGVLFEIFYRRADLAA